VPGGERKLSFSTINQALSAVRFFFLGAEAARLQKDSLPEACGGCRW
jgi:hypothetical protein